MSITTELNLIKVSKYFTAYDLICCGKTFHNENISNLPEQQKTWEGISSLAKELLDPLVEEFGMPIITYCFSSSSLSKKIKKNIYPPLDQHAGSELNKKSKMICERGGQAVDLHYPHISSSNIVKWIEKNIKFDRIYFYGDNRPIHVSIGPQNSRSIIYMKEINHGKKIPRKITIEWLRKINSSD